MYARARAGARSRILLSDGNANKKETIPPTYHTATGAVKQQALARREIGQLEEQNVSHGVVHGDGGRVEVAHPRW